MINYHYGKPGKQDWSYVANVFAAHESLSSEQTSSLPLVQFWKKDDGFAGRVKEMQAKLGNVNILTNDSKLYFEYGVSVPPGFGRGKASMTDLMIISKNQVVAIEAKYTEYLNSKYEPLGKWLNESKSLDNRRKVLAGWMQYIVKFGGIDISHEKDTLTFVNRFVNEDGVNEIPYQLIHRIASACAVANEKSFKAAMVIYQLFYDKENKEKMESFSRVLKKAICTLGLKNRIKFYVVGVESKYQKGDEIPERLNDLFLVMQKDTVYSFGQISLLATNQQQ